MLTVTVFFLLLYTIQYTVFFRFETPVLPDTSSKNRSQSEPIISRQTATNSEL